MGISVDPSNWDFKRKRLKPDCPNGEYLQKIIRLAGCDYINKAENILLTGSTGVGKSYLASAIGHQAFTEGYRVLYFNMDKLHARLKMAKIYI